MIVIVDQVKLEYWKGRLCQAESNTNEYRISISPETLRWFIETIEFLQSNENTKDL